MEYRLYFGQSILRSYGHAMTETISYPIPTRITFKARSQDHADKKVEVMATKMHLYGTVKAIKEAKT
jgi:hypothetical protein